MKLRILFFYFAFVALASVLMIAISDSGSDGFFAARKQKFTTSRAAVLSAENSDLHEIRKDETIACARNPYCPDCNVILLSVDSLRADHVGAYGYERNTTPFFDELAKTGVLFENYFSSSFLTPVSEMSVHTGMFPSAHQVTNFDTALPRHTTTIAEHMRANGYATAAFFSSPEFEINPALKESFSRGFDVYDFITKWPDPAALFNTIRMFPTEHQLTQVLDRFPSTKFFWWMGIGGVHWPYGAHGPNIFADDAYNGVLKDKLLAWQGVFDSVYGERYYAGNASITDNDVRYVRDQYDNGVRAFDEFLKLFIGELDKRGLREKTLIIIQSEHGEDLHEHGYFAHYDILDTQTHTPLLILFPHSEKGCRIDSFAGSTDVFPTVTDVLEISSLRQFEGKSLAPLMNGKEMDGMRDEVFLERRPLWEETFSVASTLKERGIDVGGERHGDFGIRTLRWKYILRTSKRVMEKISWWQMISRKKIQFPAEELYDLANDPGEMKNVVGEYPAEAAALKKTLLERFQSVIVETAEKPEIIPTIQPYF